jgi:O-antigen/teichoic acid export membrane protein
VKDASRSRQLLRGGAAIAVAMGVMNVTTYAFTILAARLLGPAEYGALAAVMGLLLVVNVLSLGLQATGARRVSATPHDLTHIERQVMSASYRSALALGVLIVVASPLLATLLHLDTWLVPLMVAVTAVPLTVMGGQAGVLQGERRWAPLALIYLSVGVGRLAFGAIALVVHATTLSAMVGVAVGAVAPAVIGAMALRHPDRQQAPADGGERVTAAAPTRGGVVSETLHNSHALLAFFALSNVDVVTARITLAEHQAGLYAGGLILAKAVLFLPQFVVVLAFPSMADDAGGSTRLKSLLMVLGLGLVSVVGAALLPTIAVEFVGGGEYQAIASLLWVFAGLGTLLCMLQVMVYDMVARQLRRVVFLIWAALVAVLCTIPFVDSVREWLLVVVGVDSTLLATLLLVSRRRQRVRPEAAARAASVG